jgi:D-amino peptidase
MKVFISSDLEGAAGVVDWSQCRPSGGQAYESACRLLLGEVNAALEGAHAGGATEALVNDSHGAMANLPPDELATDATYLSGAHKPHYMMEGLDPTFGAALFIAYHGSIESHGALSHTYNPRAVHAARLNGEPTGEAGINALVAVAHGVPVALISGDQIATEEALRVSPKAEVVNVKRSITRFAAESTHPAGARRMISEGARRAVERSLAGEIPPPALSSPFVLEIDWLTADMAELASAVRGVERTAGRTTTVAGDDPLACYRCFVAAIAITRSIVES